MAITKVFLANDAPLPRRADSRIDKFDESFRFGLEVYTNLPQITVLPYVLFEGEASFIPGGSVDVELEGWRKHVTMFSPDTVLWIDGGVIGKRIYNHHTCPRCCRISCQLVSDMPGNIAGRSYLRFRCPECHNEWRFDNV